MKLQIHNKSQIRPRANKAVKLFHLNVHYLQIKCILVESAFRKVSQYPRKLLWNVFK